MNNINRKDFLKKTCLSGVCLCGFSSIGLSHSNNEKSEIAEEEKDNNTKMMQTWIGILLSNIDETFSEKEKKSVLKSCSTSHYENLKMDEILNPYINNLDKFIEFLENEWGWKIEYDQVAKTLIANENKNYCVCPMIKDNKKAENSAICYCSEGFAEKMFSVVTGHTASATVLSSIQRGNNSCIYKIVFN